MSQQYIGPKMKVCHFSNFCRNKFPGFPTTNQLRGYPGWLMEQIGRPQIFLCPYIISAAAAMIRHKMIWRPPIHSISPPGEPSVDLLSWLVLLLICANQLEWLIVCTNEQQHHSWQQVNWGFTWLAYGADWEPPIFFCLSIAAAAEIM